MLQKVIIAALLLLSSNFTYAQDNDPSTLSPEQLATIFQNSSHQTIAQLSNEENAKTMGGSCYYKVDVPGRSYFIELPNEYCYY